MLQKILQNILLFVALVLIQVLVLNNIQFLGFVNPYIYILFLLSQPVKQPRMLTLTLAFMLGITIDIFSSTLGIHAFATVFVAFIRSGVIKLFFSIDEGFNPSPSFFSLGVGVYIRYVSVIVVIHHILLFTLEAFSFANFGFVLLKALLSAIITILLILGTQSFNKK
ncbi:MAG: rod shape-determining protein MreD [Paludibacter sp.]|jgi:rod shape-determining protein MreD|nr:rod shape-determining protein MreD [Paludibacter sp.]